jgi:hypothetical protein
MHINPARHILWLQASAERDVQLYRAGLLRTFSLCFFSLVSSALGLGVRMVTVVFTFGTEKQSPPWHRRPLLHIFQAN